MRSRAQTLERHTAQRAVVAAVACFALAVVACAPTCAAASPCCSSVVAFGASRLAAWERAAVGVHLGASHERGWWDDAGRLHRLGRGQRQDAFSAELWGLVALSPRLQLSVGLPWHIGLRSAAGIDAIGSAPGDVRLGLRADWAAVGSRPGWPGVALVASLIVPTGRRAEEAGADLGADASGRGAFRPAIAAVVEGAVGDLFWRADAGLVAPLPFLRSDSGVWQRDGLAVAWGATIGAQLGRYLVVSAAVRWQAESAYHYDGREIADSERWISQVATGIGLRLTPEWIVASNFAWNPLGRWVAGYNEAEAWRVGISLRRGILD